MLVARAAPAAPPAGIDLQALPLPLSAEPASVLESPHPRSTGDFGWTLRTSGLRRPLTLRLPSPSPEGTSAGLIEGVALTELSASVGLGEGWDAGFGFGVHLAQTVVDENNNGDSSSRVVRFRGRDPRLGIGWAKRYGKWSLRPFAQVHIPLGDEESFSGESRARVLLGAAGGLDLEFLRWTVDAGFLYRSARSISSTTWGPQWRTATGIFVPLFEPVEVGAQFVVLPVLSRQEGVSGDRGGRLIPAEALGGLRYRLGSLSCGLGVGLGLPLSRTSSIHVERKNVRGPTTPVYRGFFDISYEK